MNVSTLPITFQNQFSFVAIRANGAVVMWGDARTGGDCSRIQNDIMYIQSTWPVR